jgi:hypothetical protein
MGFTIETYSLYGLPPLPNIYCSIQGSYSVKKNRPVKGYYQIFCTAYFSASKNDPVITEKDMLFQIEALPSPANIYLTIYEFLKGDLDAGYNTDKQALVFRDD